MKAQGTKISLILLVFLLFLCCAMGILEINIISDLNVSFNSQLLRNNPIISSQLLLSKEFALFVFIGVLLTICLPLLGPMKGSLLTAVLMVLPVMLNYYFPGGNSLLPMEFTLMMILMLYVINIMVSYFMELHLRDHIVETMGHYIPPQIVDRISRGEETISLEGESRTLSVLFCDIKDFTAIAEKLKPKQVASLLNEYFTALSKILYSYDGTIDKFIGDALMAFWGAPLKMHNHAQASIMAAIEMEQEVNRVNAIFKQRGWPELKTGFGISTGPVSVGNMGSKYRLAYTVIGDSVNVAARIEKLTRTYNVPIIVNESTMLECDDIVFRELDRIVLKGRQAPSRIYQPLGLRTETDEHLLRGVQQHAEGLVAYYNQAWKKSLKIYQELTKAFPNDRYYTYMIEKLEDSQVN